MTDKLIINGINWLDLRMVGLLCWFDDSPYIPPYIARISHVFSNGRGQWFVKDLHTGNVEYMHKCRLAQGEKITYDGKGQPVPDGVLVECWYSFKSSISDGPRIYPAHTVTWLNVTHYQVQEQKLDVTEITDTRRLDWLIENRVLVHSGGLKSPDPYYFIGYRNGTTGASYPAARDAIDTEIKGKINDHTSI